LLAEMANQEHLDILAKGVEAWNAWRRRNPNTLCELSDSNLSRAVLSKANLGLVRLRGATLSEATLTGSDLTAADLGGADLRGAHLRNANLTGANLTGADLTGANLRLANLKNTAVNNTNLDGAKVGLTSFADIDLSTARNLGKVQHAGPSSISLDTIYRSHGQIPESFLRGAGIPENFITFMKSLTGAALEFYSVFISYSTKDQDFADRLYADLQARGIRCWFAPHDIQGGRKVHEQIDEAIRLHDKLLLILSDASMNSNWVKTEIANARTRETQQHRQMLFPITLVPFDSIRGWKSFDADTGIDSAREIREYFVPDFSNWKDHDSYSRAFERLLRDLKAGPSDKAAAQPAL
jgi:TIR domain/Pentapeptide repeats (8 copies)